ncbi:MAG: transglutaminase domain-containing protein [Planctomycetes bacterium]|nr:transglutaminase domain-containing protein [Planctomycetota bacterium]
MALPQDSDVAQKISDLKIGAPIKHEVKRDSEGNQVLYLESDLPLKSPDFSVVATFKVTRSELKSGVDAEKTRALNDAERKEHAHDLQANQNVVISDDVKKLSADIVKDEKNPVKQARALYDWTLKNIDYWVKDPANKKASPVGSSEYCLTTKTGNYTDFHSLWAALARASGIPTRIVYGSLFKPELDGQDTDASYHCWIEFFAPQIGWVPLDVAVADIYDGTFTVNKDNETMVRRTTADGYRGPEPEKVNYYFGNLDDRRVTWSVGRDLVLDPKPACGTLNALPKAYIEIDGKPAAEKTVWTRKLTYKELKS